MMLSHMRNMRCNEVTHVRRDSLEQREGGGWDIDMERPGKFATLDHCSEPSKASAMCLLWSTCLLGDWRRTL